MLGRLNICMFSFLPACALKKDSLPDSATPKVPVTNESRNWQEKHPRWLFSDDFESNEAMVKSGRYFEYNDNGGEFVAADGAGVNGSRRMRAKWKKGVVEAGNPKLGFGRQPDSYMYKGIRSTEDFRDIYYRMYLKMGDGVQKIINIIDKGYTFEKTFVMKKEPLYIIYALTALFLLGFIPVVSASLLVITPPDGSDEIPFDGGLSVLIAAGVAYGAKKAYDKRKKGAKDEESTVTDR